MPIAALYVIESFLNADPVVRIVLRSAPVLPAAIWTLWLDAARPFLDRPAPFRLAGRLVLLALIMGFAVGLLGLALNWLYDPNRVI